MRWSQKKNCEVNHQAHSLSFPTNQSCEKWMKNNKRKKIGANSPKSMLLIIRNVWKQSLINVEDPGILAVSIDLHWFRELQSRISYSFRIWPIAVASCVVLNKRLTSRGNPTPRSSVISLNSESPTITEQKVVPNNLPVGREIIRRKRAIDFREDFKDRLGKGER